MSKNFSEKMMAGILAFLLLTLPVVALPNPEVIGRVVGSNAASLDGVGLPNGGTILNKDLLTTGMGGKALVQFSPSSRVTLSENTSVRFLRRGSSDVGAMLSGSLVAESRGADDVVVQTPKYKVEPVDGVNTIYLVAMMPDRSTVVAAKDGRVAITGLPSGQKYVLPAGKYAVIPAVSASAPGEGGPGPSGPAIIGWHIDSLSHAASIALVAAIAAGTAAAIAIPLATSGGPASPSGP